MIILRKIFSYIDEFSHDFELDGFHHSRQIDEELTSIVKNLDTCVSKYKNYISDEIGEITYYDIWLKEDPSKFFWICDFDTITRENPSPNKFKGWEIHFKTWNNLREDPTKDSASINESQKQRLFKSIDLICPEGKLLSSYGTITKGGIHALERFENYNFKRVGTANPLLLPDKKERAEIPIWKKI